MVSVMFKEGKRRALVSLLLWGLVITGIIIFLTILIIAFVFLGQKSPVYAHFLYWWLLSFHYVAWGYNFAILFATLKLGGVSGGLFNQSVILALLYVLAVIFDILAGIFYGILGFEACAGTNQDQVEAGICDNDAWIVWVLWLLIIALIIHAAVGVMAALMDRFMSKTPVASTSVTGGLGVSDITGGGEGDIEESTEGANNRFSKPLVNFQTHNAQGNFRIPTNNNNGLQQQPVAVSYIAVNENNRMGAPLQLLSGGGGNDITYPYLYNHPKKGE